MKLTVPIEEILNTFIKYTKFTIPYDNEELILDELPKGHKIYCDEHNNYFIVIGNIQELTTMFTCHLDDVSSVCKWVTHKYDGRILSTASDTILGADDKAGAVAMHYLIENEVPGLYYYFVGEERGCIGSSALAKKCIADRDNGVDHILSNITKCISLDRKGIGSIITKQGGTITASDEFAKELGDILAWQGVPFKRDPTGVNTDSCSFVKLIPECTNLSLATYSGHLKSENIDIPTFGHIVNALLKVPWEDIKAHRDINAREVTYYNGYNRGMY